MKRDGEDRGKENGSRLIGRVTGLLGTAGLVLLFALGAGCKTGEHQGFSLEPTTAQDVVRLNEGDVVQIRFPGAPDLDTEQQVRRDGRISLPGLGEMNVTGMTPTQVEEELIRLYGSQLQAKLVNVTIRATNFPVYVSGAVLRPGKVVSDRPLTALEAIMEAGGPDYSRANLKNVMVIRREEDFVGYNQHRLNLKRPLEGHYSEPFMLERLDVVYVPERFEWF